MSNERPAPPGGQRKTAKRRPDRPYRAPELQEYGSLKELTRANSTLTPGDLLGGSFAT